MSLKDPPVSIVAAKKWMFAIVNCATVWVRDRDFPEGIQTPFRVVLYKDQRMRGAWFKGAELTVTRMDVYKDEEPAGGRGRRVGDHYLALRLLRQEIASVNH